MEIQKVYAHTCLESVRRLQRFCLALFPHISLAHLARSSWLERWSLLNEEADFHIVFPVYSKCEKASVVSPWNSFGQIDFHRLRSTVITRPAYFSNSSRAAALKTPGRGHAATHCTEAVPFVAHAHSNTVYSGAGLVPHSQIKVLIVHGHYDCNDRQTKGRQTDDSSSAVIHATQSLPGFPIDCSGCHCPDNKRGDIPDSRRECASESVLACPQDQANERPERPCQDHASEGRPKHPGVFDRTTFVCCHKIWFVCRFGYCLLPGTAVQQKVKARMKVIVEIPKFVVHPVVNSPKEFIDSEYDYAELATVRVPRCVLGKNQSFVFIVIDEVHTETTTLALRQHTSLIDLWYESICFGLSPVQQVPNQLLFTVC